MYVRNHAELNYYIATMGGGKSLHLLWSEHVLAADTPTLVVKPASDLKAGRHVETRLGETRRKVDFLISDDTDIEKALLARLEQMHTQKNIPLTHRPWLFVDEGQFLLPRHVEQLRDIVDKDIAHVKVYGLLTDFRGEFFPGSEALVKTADHVETLRPANHEHFCEKTGCDRVALRNARLIDGKVTRQGEQIAIDGIDATYEALCSRHYRENR